MPVPWGLVEVGCVVVLSSRQVPGAFRLYGMYGCGGGAAGGEASAAGGVLAAAAGHAVIPSDIA